MVFFETGKWIISHQGMYNLSQSGMSGRMDLGKYFRNCGMGDEQSLRERIANLNGADKENVVITHGATEALFLSLYHLRSSGIKKYRTKLPEYEPLIKDPPELGFEPGDGGVLVFSNTNNPTGAEIKVEDNYSAYIVDDTFLQFHRDLDTVRYPDNTFRINTFTKFYGGDDVRLGYIITPRKEDAEKINSLKGIFTEQVSRYNICVADSILRDNEEIKQFVRKEMEKNLNHLINHMGRLRFYNNIEPVTGTVTFMDYSSYSHMDSISMGEYLSKNSISVVPGRIFGVDGPYIRVCYTRENFRESLSALIENLEKLVVQ